MFRFTIRDGLWLVVVAIAVVIAWQNFVARGVLERRNLFFRIQNSRPQRDAIANQSTGEFRLLHPIHAAQPVSH
jgi:hypothetical protein